VSLQGLFPPGQGSTIGVDFMIKTIQIDEDAVKVCTLRFVILHVLGIAVMKYGFILNLSV